MRRFSMAVACLSVLILFGAGQPLAVYNGAEDGAGHPAVGFVVGTSDPIRATTRLRP